jgi:hypothetical protein
MKKQHLALIGISLITIIVSLFFGMSIQNAQDNFLIDHLNLEDGINYFDVNEVPKLSFTASAISLIFIIALLGLEFYIIKKSTLKKIKSLAIGAIIFLFIIFIFALLTLNNPHYFNFKHFGLIWVILCLNVIFINVVSLFVKK